MTKSKKPVLGREDYQLFEATLRTTSNQLKTKAQIKWWVILLNLILIPLKLTHSSPELISMRKRYKISKINQRSWGVIQPITVRKLEFNKYQLISGERRLRASK